VWEGGGGVFGFTNVTVAALLCVACSFAFAGDPASDSPRNAPWHAAYHGLARAFVRSSLDATTPLSHRRRLLTIDLESGLDGVAQINDNDSPLVNDIVLRAEVLGSPHIAPVTLTIPVSTDINDLPLAVASRSV
jgi:hypothetical protein